MPELGSVLRVVVSLGLVLALLWVAARYLSRSRAGASAGVDVDVLARVPLAQKSSLAVVRLGEQALVLGITESRVELLTSAPVSEVVDVAQVAEVAEVAEVGGIADNTDNPVAATVAVPGLASGSGSGPAGSPVSPAPVSRVAARRSRQAAQSSPLAGSVLSPQTWTKAVAALREMTVRS
jgi:flagellar protein FliO/FliZ